MESMLSSRQQGHAKAAGMWGHGEAAGMNGQNGNISDHVHYNTVVDIQENEDFVSEFWESDSDEP